MSETSIPKLEKNDRGIFVIEWFEKMPTGKWNKRSKTTGKRDPQEAQKEFGKFLAAGGPTPPETTTYTVQQATDIYLREKADPEGNGKHQRQALKPPLRALAALPVEAVNADRITRYTAERQSGLHGPEGRARRPIAPATIRRELNALAAAINWLRKTGRVKEVHFIPRPADGDRRKVWMDERQEQRFIAALADEPRKLRVYALMPLCYGVRVGAVKGLEWEWGVDWRSGTIDFNPPGKRVTRKRRPRVPIASMLETDLKALFLESGGKGKVVGDQRRGYRAFLAKHGFEQFTMHTLKHTFATLGFRSGETAWDLSSVCATDPKTLSEVYGHHAADQQKQVIERRRKTS